MFDAISSAQVPLMYAIVHKKHHTKTVQRATEALRLSLLEEILDVACSIVAVNVTRAHPLSRTCYNIVVIYLIIELHCGTVTQQPVFFVLADTPDK